MHLRLTCFEHSGSHQVYIKFIKTQMGHFLRQGRTKERKSLFLLRKHVKKGRKKANKKKDLLLEELRLIKCDVISGRKRKGGGE